MAPCHCPQYLEYWILWVKCDGSKSLVNCKIIINLIELDSGERSFFSAPGLSEVVFFADSLAWILPGLGIPKKLINLKPDSLFQNCILKIWIFLILFYLHVGILPSGYLVLTAGFCKRLNHRFNDIPSRDRRVTFALPSNYQGLPSRITFRRTDWSLKTYRLYK